jgi:hypothetical protein
MMSDFEAEGIPFSYMVELYESRAGGVPSSEDADYYAGAIGVTTPVLADPTQALHDAMPFGGLPSRCAVSPRMEILDCWTGHAADLLDEPAINAIRDHFAAAGG